MTPAELTAARKALHLSQAELARVLGVHPNVVNRWSLGKAKMPPYMGWTLFGLAAKPALGSALWVLMNRRNGDLPDFQKVAAAAESDARNALDLAPELAAKTPHCMCGRDDWPPGATGGIRLDIVCSKHDLPKR